ncbi:hypothetical protein NPX13_g4422 [Xylaria arbuscula]|uniref:Uncharacterized protein n=1 Tax=Xylaria arbuscula TaxID=114810 RepID=A0A9W8TM87_9PEZI|nr:hypothetical protein NPX13_g4422 [Xylaria arbuscula]
MWQVTITKTVEKLDESLSRIRPRLYYIIFIFCDFGALTLQAIGGAVSTVSSGSNAVGVDLALTGLIFQVVTMLVFVGLVADYLIRYFQDKPFRTTSLRLKLFLGSISFAILLILGRCAYRVAEREFWPLFLPIPFPPAMESAATSTLLICRRYQIVSEGYSGTLFHDESLFIGLEGVLIVIAVVALAVGHPGFVFGADQAKVGGAHQYILTPGSRESGRRACGRAQGNH